MLPKPYRLVKKKDFETVFKSGKSVKSGFLTGKALKNNLSASRFGFVVSKKVSPKATVRNKVRRRLQATVAKELKTMDKFLDVVIVALPGTENKEFGQVKAEVINFFKKL